MPEPHLRAADDDRAAVAEILGRHMSAGRLTMDEYDERLARAYAAKTYGELDELTADLPRANGSKSPARAASTRQPSPADRPAMVPARTRGSAADAWRAWLTTGLIVTTIWLLTSLGSGEFNYFWPIWVIGPWGAILLAQSITGGGHHGRDRHRSRQLH
jgi:hypothetical protein